MPCPTACRKSTSRTESPSLRFFDLFDGRRPHQQQQEIGVFRAGDEHLLAVDDIVIALADGHRLQLRRIRSRRRLRHAERLQAKIAIGNRRQILPLLILRPVTEQRRHDVHLRMTCGGVATGPVDLLENDRGLRDAEPRAPVLLGDERGEVARPGQAPDELLRVFASGFEASPVGVAKTPAEFADVPAQTVVEVRVTAGVIIRIDRRVTHCGTLPRLARATTLLCL